MKLAKLSLAAIMAVGALSVANAQPLEEAIKGVDLNGMIRYRWYDYDLDVPTVNKDDRSRFSTQFNFVAPVADNFTAGLTVRGESSQYGDDQGSSNVGTEIEKFWFKYAKDAYSVKVGKQEIDTPWTEAGYNGSRGNGAVALYTGVSGWTFAGAAFSQTNGADADFRVVKAAYKDSTPSVDLDITLGKNYFDQENLFAAAVIGSVGPVNMQLWAAKKTNVIDSSFFGQLDTKMAGFSLKGQVNILTLDSDLAKKLKNDGITNGDDTGTFYGVEGAYTMDNFTLGAGYSSNDDDQGIYTLDEDDKIMDWGKETYAKTVNKAGTDTIAVYAKAKFGAVGVGAGYVDYEIQPTGATTSIDLSETYVDASYKYAKNLKFTAYYSINENDTKTNKDFNVARFEAKYTF